jgi:hypothetical protein
MAQIKSKTKKAAKAEVVTASSAFTGVMSSAEAIKNDETKTLGSPSTGDNVRQGDIYIVFLGPREKFDLDKVGGGEPITDRQLAQGNTQGARHVLEGPAKLFKPKDVNAVAAHINSLRKGYNIPGELVGPVCFLEGQCELTHPEHGNFIMPGGEVVAAVFQRDYAEEEIRRTRD